MFAALIIVFREVVEAGLVVGVVLAVTQNVPGRLRYVFGGVAAGIAGAGIVALFTGLIAEALAGSGQEVLNASVLGHRRRYADLAQCLDGTARPRDDAGAE